MINRINLILRAKNITARQFAEEIGIQPSGMSHILGGRNNPSLEFVNKVLRRYPEIDANWLLLGRGEMYRSSLAPTLSNQTVVPLAEDDKGASDPSLFVEEESMEDVLQSTEYQSDDFCKTKECHVEDVLVMYSDGTFRNYRPQVNNTTSRP